MDTWSFGNNFLGIQEGVILCHILKNGSIMMNIAFIKMKTYNTLKTL